MRRLVHWSVDMGEGDVWDASEGIPAPHADHLLAGLPYGMIVHPISNGYLMRIEDNPHDLMATGQIRHSLLVFAKNANGIAKEIIAAQARKKINPQGELAIPNPVVNPTAGQALRGSATRAAAPIK